MITICYGVTKSASTLLYQITEEAYRLSGRPAPRLAEPLRPALSVNNYFDRIDADLLRRVTEHLGHDDVVLKTHGRLDPEIAERIAAGTIIASATIRDPREIALSMVDHGRRARQWGEIPFRECVEPRDCLQSIDLQLGAFAAWSALPNVEVYRYNDICFDTEETANRVFKQIGVTGDSAKIARRFAQRSRIGQFSKGQALRYDEMATADQRVFLDRYADLYDRIDFDTHAARIARDKSGNRQVKPSGGLRQRIAHWRRLLRV